MSKSGDVPNHVEYRRFAAHDRAIEGIIPLALLPRVAAITQKQPVANDVAQLQLTFAEDAQRRVRVSGSVSASLTLQCQRCTRLFEQSVDAGIAGVVVADEQAAAGVPRADEPILADGDSLDVHALVEDELLLALPMVARCDDPQCRANYDTQPLSDQAQPKRKDNPFAVLDQLKRDDDK